MNELTLTLAIAATFVLAGTVKGVTGMGLPTVAMGILGSLISPLAAAGMLLLPSFLTNLFQLYEGGNLPALLKRLWPMMLTIVLGTLASSSLLASGSSHATTIALGTALIIYALWTLFASPLHIPPRHEPWLSPLIGLLTGLLTGGTGVFVIPAVPYIQSLGLQRDELVQALGLSFTFSTLALAAGLWWHGALQDIALGTSLMAVLAALIGLFAGQRIRKRISPVAFKRGFLVCLILLGADMVLRALL
ncbi:sulfite exporter TauE/SafE family protein [Cedecea sp. FDAARGOS_727]|uniref:sulfite exporter TauE/SafE family protein n=1 Tax=Cedecea sp. FDAARGOS_727 TaxID=2545798 RepID=UPI00143E93A0|nr:sulfite exporter TauE/SafE family protein [Cedecea sp. FDAARGOS_727]QIX97770.1 sulfite exporter TauE/SafE family protein [Cedecea sp. FDAARGOS_727]